jgi:hypothetical protein
MRVTIERGASLWRLEGCAFNSASSSGAGEAAQVSEVYGRDMEALACCSRKLIRTTN